MHLTDDPTLPTGRWLLVVNPTAGAGRALAACEGVVEALRTHGLEPEVYVSPDIDAAEEAAAACGPDDVVVSLGGDGLHGRIAAGTMRGGALFAPLPAGRGNDYVRTIGLPLDPVEAARHLGTARERRVDLGYVNGKPFLGVASLGFEAMANEYANRSRFKRGPVYIWGALRAILAVRPLHLSLDTGDGPVPSTPLSVQVCQTGRYGGGVVLVPDASIDDGLLDLVVEAPPSRIPYVGFLLAMVSGHHTRPSWLHHSRVSAVHIGGSPEILVYADGDPIDHLPVDVAIERQVVRLLA